ncbi:type IV pilus biogenesis protein PilM [Neobacillus drentensis]|uniref:type IV pilus biogenesis protein PilM n=1 Tax=Neobacillus drentensis TaxID=220684 RepID=UPI00300159FF
MAFSLFTSKNRIINLVINDHSIRFLELKQTNPPGAQKWGERLLPPGIISNGKIIDIDSLANILEECIDDWKIQRRSVCFIVPDQLVIIRKVTVPAEIQDDEMKGYLYLELGSSIHLPFEEPFFDFFSLSNNGKTKDLLLFAAPEQHVMEYAELFTSLKLNPIAADISPLALYRLFHGLGLANQNEKLIIVQIDLTHVNLCIFEDSVPVIMRPFSLPFNLDQWDIKRGSVDMLELQFIGDTDEMVIQFEDIFKELLKILDFYRYSLSSEKQDVSRFLLTGDHPMLQAIVNEMKERFEVPVDLLSLDDKLHGKTGSMPANFLLSLGLALKEVK